MNRSIPRISSIALVAFAAVLVSCAPDASESAPTPSVSGEQSDLSHLDSQTLWSIAESGEQLPDDDPDVQAVRTLVTVHSGAIDNRGAEGLDESIDAEFALYTEEFAGTLEGVGWQDAARDRAIAQGVTTEQRGLGWMQSTVAEDRRSATAQYETYVVFTQANPDFLESNGITLNEEYVMLREVAVVSDGSEWFINDVRESGLQERTVVAEGNGATD